jgi:glutathione S-transferase
MSSGMCPYAARTMMVLNELELPFDQVEILGKPDWFLNINPRGKVPALRHNGEIVYESAICDEYLCDIYDTKANLKVGLTTNKLMPKNDPIAKAKIRLLNDQCDTVLNPAFFTFLMNKDEANDEELKKKLDDVLQVYEQTLTSNGGPYLTGKEFTLADIHVLPFFLRLFVSLRHFKNYHITEESHPKLVKWFKTCSDRESVKTVSKPDEMIIAVYQKFIDMEYRFGGLNKN